MVTHGEGEEEGRVDAYTYVLYAPYAKAKRSNGLVNIQARGDYVCWLTVTATDKQYGGEGVKEVLKRVAESFRV